MDDLPDHGSGYGMGLPGLGASFAIAGIPASRKRFRQRAGFSGVISNSCAISWSTHPLGGSQHDACALRLTRRAESAGLLLQKLSLFAIQTNGSGTGMMSSFHCEDDA
jgi:hypothetical protein